MADEQSLDSFFAKKDKSKKTKKGKKKTKTNEDVETQSDTTGNVQTDEWKDFEETKQKDYSSLKIQDLQLGEDESKEEMDEENYDDDEIDGEKASNDNKIWKVSSNQDHDASAPPVDNTPNVVGGKYVPPSLKRAQISSQTPNKRPGVAPDIKSQATFPTLGAANQELSSGKTPSDFEMVKKGTRTNDARMDNSRAALNLDNRYAGLKS